MTSTAVDYDQKAGRTRPRGYYKTRRPPLTRRQYKEVQKIAHKEIMKDDEHKYIATTGNAISVGITGVLNTWTRGITIGDSASSRDGNCINIRSIECRLNLTVDDAVNFCRVIVFRWFTPRVDPTLATFLEDTTLSWLSMKSQDHKNEFKVLMDRSYVLTTSNPTVSDHLFYKFKKNAYGRWNSTSSAATDSEGGHIYVYFISDSVVGGPSLNYTAVVQYTDS